jgi:hypothetical protein
VLPLDFLSPKVVEMMVEGRQPPDLTVLGLSRKVDLPLLWARQEQAIGVPVICAGLRFASSCAGSLVLNPG